MYRRKWAFKMMLLMQCCDRALDIARVSAVMFADHRLRAGPVPGAPCSALRSAALSRPPEAGVQLEPTAPASPREPGPLSVRVPTQRVWPPRSVGSLPHRAT